jgi:hypothetical protein
MTPVTAAWCLLALLQAPAGDGFSARMERLAIAVDAADPAAAATLARSIPSSEQVVSGGHTYDVRFEWLRTALTAAPADPRAWPSRRGALAARLRTIGREAASMAPAGDLGAARRALDAVLAQRSFQRARTPSWQSDVRRRAAEWLADLFERTIGRRIPRGGLARVVAWTVSIAAVLVLVLWLVRTAPRRRRERPVSLGPLPVHRTPGHVLALEAAALIRAGRIREAVRVAYGAAVKRLEEEGALRVDETRTPREYLGLLPAAHRRRATLSTLTVTFERIWYGAREAAPDDGARILTLLQEMGCLVNQPK